MKSTEMKRRKKMRRRKFFIGRSIYAWMGHISGSGSISRWSVIVAPGNLAPSLDSSDSDTS
jgi:hypothetical protein